MTLSTFKPALLSAFAAAALTLGLGDASAAPAGFKVGDPVEAHSPMSGRWERGRIVALDGERYMFKADDKTLANDFWGAMAQDLRPVGAGAAQAEAAPRPAAPRPAAAAACGGGGGGASVRIAGAVAAPLGKGRWPNGQPLGVPGQTNYKTDAQGRKTIVAVAPPGTGSYLGAFNLMVGGTWSTASIRDLGDGRQERTLTWNVPAKANVLVINPDHSWYRQSGSQRYFGRWIDLGQEVVQLIGYDGDDWTGSVQRAPDGICRMEMRSWLGQTEWGRRV